MLKQHNRLMVLLFAGTDVILTIGSVALAYAIRFRFEPFLERFPAELGIQPFSDFFNLPTLLAVSLTWLTIFSFNGLYRPRRGKSLIDEFYLLVTSVLLALVTLLGLSFFYRGTEYSRAVVILMFVINVTLLTLSRFTVRSILRALRKRGFNQRQVVIAGAGDLGLSLLQRFREHPALGYEVVGFLDDDPGLENQRVHGVPVLGKLNDTREILSRRTFDYIYLALPLSEYDKMVSVMAQLKDELVDVKFVPDILQYVPFQTAVEELDGMPVISMHSIPMTGWRLLIKRSLDVLFASIMMLVLSPILMVCAALIKLTSSGPVLYSQERLGLDGKTFTMLKFRTMDPSRAGEKQGPQDWTERDDPRITSVGRFMRRWGLDELPQLLNVIAGQMSLVGPRPEQPLFVEQFKGSVPRYMLRHKVRAGLTGWAQIHGLRGDTSIEKRIQFDLYYINNWSLALDVKILLLTLLRVRLNAH